MNVADAMQEMIRQCNKAQGSGVDWIDCGPSVIASIRNCTIEEAQAWLEKNAEPLGCGWYRLRRGR